VEDGVAVAEEAAVAGLLVRALPQPALAGVGQFEWIAVREAAQRLSRYELARLASGHSSRAVKYRHLAEDALGLDQAQLAILCVLLLRGPQTPGELKQRTERMVRFDSLDAVESVLAMLGERGYARRLERRPGQKEDRFEQRLGGGGGAGGGGGGGAGGGGEPPATRAAAPTFAAPPSNGLAGRVDALEAEVAALRAELTQLRELLD